MSRFKGRIIIILLIGVGIYFLATKNTGRIPRPTSDYYVNDYANQLSSAVEGTIIANAERLYEDTQDLPDGGAQIVFATFSVDDLADIANYDKTDIYRAWKIGKNDMGVLVLYFFQKDTSEFLEVQVELGYSMEQYLPPSMVGNIVDETIMATDDIDYGTAHLLFEILYEVYENAYGDYYYPFNYDMEEYQIYLDNYSGSSSSTSSIEMGYISYILSPYSSLGSKIFSGFALLFLFGLGGGFVIRSGGGGSSGGMGIFRRRR
jgi:uncharacterized protein